MHQIVVPTISYTNTLAKSFYFFLTSIFLSIYQGGPIFEFKRKDKEKKIAQANVMHILSNIKYRNDERNFIQLFFCIAFMILASFKAY